MLIFWKDGFNGDEKYCEIKNASVAHYITILLFHELVKNVSIQKEMD